MSGDTPKYERNKHPNGKARLLRKDVFEKARPNADLATPEAL